MRRKNAIIIATILLLVTAGLIFVMSSKDAEHSMNDNIQFDRILAEILVDGFEEMTPEEQFLAAAQFDEPIRHVGHMIEFAVLGLLLAMLAVLIRRKLWMAFVIGCGYGAFDEIHQLFVEGRGCQLSDLCFDAIGVLTGIIVVWLVVRTKRVE